jgi:hypothetical protein
MTQDPFFRLSSRKERPHCSAHDRRFPRSENTPQSLERDTPFSRQFGLFRQILVGDFWIPCLVLATSIRTTLGMVLLGEPSFQT